MMTGVNVTHAELEEIQRRLTQIEESLRELTEIVMAEEGDEAEEDVSLLWEHGRLERRQKFKDFKDGRKK